MTEAEKPILRITLEKPVTLKDIKFWADTCIQVGMVDPKTAVETNFQKIIASSYTKDLQSPA